MRSSGSFSIRMMMPTVPMAWISSGVGFSTSNDLLRREEDHTIAGQRRFNGLDGHVSSDEQRQHHIRKDDDIPNRQQRKLVRGFRYFAVAENLVRIDSAIGYLLRG